MIDQESFLDGFGTAMVLMSSMHGLLLALILFFNNRLRSKANRYLALAIFAASIVLSMDIVYYFDIEYQLGFLQYFPVYLRTIVPVGIFYFVLFLIDPKHQFSVLEKSGFGFIALEILVELIYIPVNIFASDENSIEYWEDVLVMIEQFVGLVACFLFFWLAMRKVMNYQKYLFNHYSTTTHKSLGWLHTFLIMNLTITVLWLLSYTQQLFGFYEAAEETFILVTIGLGLFLFFIGYYLILKYNWFHVVPIDKEILEEESQKSKLSSKADSYYQNLIELMKEEKLYTDVELTLQNLSERLGISSSYLSRIINEKEQKNFFEFVNGYRIYEVKEKLIDEEYHHYSILGIAFESGFKSKTTFNTVFKKFTGQTPSSYQKQFQ
ncbi:MAG: helix-turn-helix domain-containing protein [Flavobacteriaceae bacterium]